MTDEPNPILVQTTLDLIGQAREFNAQMLAWLHGLARGREDEPPEWVTINTVDENVPTWIDAVVGAVGEEGDPKPIAWSLLATANMLRTFAVRLGASSEVLERYGLELPNFGEEPEEDQPWPWASLEPTHSTRFRKVSNRYPLRVWEAYEGDIERALTDTDEQVAETVADWERAQGMEPRDWKAIGEAERGPDDEP